LLGLLIGEGTVRGAELQGEGQAPLPLRDRAALEYVEQGNAVEEGTARLFDSLLDRPRGRRSLHHEGQVPVDRGEPGDLSERPSTLGVFGQGLHVDLEGGGPAE